MSGKARTAAALAAAALTMGVLTATVTTPAAIAETKDKQPLYEFATGEPVVGAFSKLDRGDGAFASQIRTSASPGHAVTIWYVIFNAPQNCSDGQCGEDDIFVNGDPNRGFDFVQIHRTRVSVVYGGDGTVANPGTRVQLDGGIAEGEIPDGEAQIVIGHPVDGAMVPGPVTGLEDAQAAELHVVLQDHGKAHDDPDKRESQLTGFQTECNPDCEDIQFAVHLP